MLCYSRVSPCNPCPSRALFPVCHLLSALPAPPTRCCPQPDTWAWLGLAELPASLCHSRLHFPAPDHVFLAFLCSLPALCITTSLCVSTARPKLSAVLQIQISWIKRQGRNGLGEPLHDPGLLSPPQPSWAARGREENTQNTQGGKERKEEAEHEKWKQQQLSPSQPSLPQQLDPELF